MTSESQKAAKARFKLAHPEKVLEYQAKYRETHKEQERLSQIEYRKANAEKIKAASAAYSAAHKEQKKAAQIKFREDMRIKKVLGGISLNTLTPLPGNSTIFHDLVMSQREILTNEFIAEICGVSVRNVEGWLWDNKSHPTEWVIYQVVSVLLFANMRPTIDSIQLFNSIRLRITSAASSVRKSQRSK